MDTAYQTRAKGRIGEDERFQLSPAFDYFGDVLLAARQPAASLYAAGERLALSWPPDALHLFDGRDGQRLN